MWKTSVRLLHSNGCGQSFGESAHNWTLSLGLSQFRSLYQVQWNLVMAATLVVMAPVIVLFFLAQRAFVEGVTLTGVKG